MTSPPPITAHLVLGEGGGELQPPGRYPGRGRRLLAGEPPRLVAAELRQPSGGGHQDQEVEQQAGASTHSRYYLLQISTQHTHLDIPEESTVARGKKHLPAQSYQRRPPAQCVLFGQAEEPK